MLIAKTRGDERVSDIRNKSMPIAALLLAAWLVAPLVASAGDRITLGMREASLDEVMAMLARQHRVNILLGDGVDAEVSFSLYNVTLDDAIRSIANAGGIRGRAAKGDLFHPAGGPRRADPPAADSRPCARFRCASTGRGRTRDEARRLPVGLRQHHGAAGSRTARRRGPARLRLQDQPPGVGARPAPAAGA